MVDSMFTPAYAIIVDAVVDMRKRAGLTQRELAARLEREQSLIGRIETGQRRIDLVEFVWIARACDLDPQGELEAITPDLIDAVR